MLAVELMPSAVKLVPAAYYTTWVRPVQAVGGSKPRLEATLDRHETCLRGFGRDLKGLSIVEGMHLGLPDGRRSLSPQSAEADFVAAGAASQARFQPPAALA
jgi:hypothetical protein